jgi:tetratricopeptide (TPR) repeat protein
MEDFDKFWNYNDPAATEIKFKEILAESPGKSLQYILQLQTQIARTNSLRALFDEAHEILDAVEKQLPATPDISTVRYHLERGRTFNSSGKKAEARTQFELTEYTAKDLNEDNYYIDALHMLAIVAPHDEAIGIQEQALIKTEESNNEEAKGWLGPLYNNLGWSYFDAGEYEKALSVFLRSLQWREGKKTAPQIFIAKWCVGRALRALNRNDDALTIQLGLFEESTTTGKPDGYVHEELGELFLLKNDTLKYPFHFEKAYELLSTDKYLLKNEAARLERIKQLAGI